MSIHNQLDRDDQTVTKGDHALELFTDHHELTRRFAQYLNEDPAPESILFFSGGGGNGKSLLLKFLQQNCCKRFLPKVWSDLQGETRFSEALAAYNDTQEFDLIPAVYHDFGLQPLDED